VRKTRIRSQSFKGLLEKLGVLLGHRRRLLRAIGELDGAPTATISASPLPSLSDITYLPVTWLPGITPVRWVAVPQPEDAGGDVGRHVLDVRRVDRLPGAGRHEDHWIRERAVVIDGEATEVIEDKTKEGKK